MKRLGVFFLLLFIFGRANGDEIQVLAGGAAKAFIDPLSAAYHQHHVKVDYQPMGRVLQTMATPEGARYDVLVVTADAAEKLGLKGARPLAKSSIGVAVREGAPVPDVSTPDGLRRALLAARKVAHINPQTGTSGKFVLAIFDKLGIAEEMKGKTLLVDAGAAAGPVARGEADLAVHQIPEILPVKGVKLAGPLPPELQVYTVYYGVAAPATKKSAAAADYLGYLSSPEAKGRLAAGGYSAP